MQRFIFLYFINSLVQCERCTGFHPYTLLDQLSTILLVEIQVAVEHDDGLNEVVNEEVIV